MSATKYFVGTIKQTVAVAENKRETVGDDERVALRFGQIVRRGRLRSKLNQTQLAQRAGYAEPGAISKIENGNSVPSIADALRLLRVLDIDVRELAWVGDLTLSDEAGPLSLESRLDNLENVIEEIRRLARER
jgi:transcriptional regulator with XRE-family HTH domain